MYVMYYISIYVMYSNYIHVHVHVHTIHTCMLCITLVYMSCILIVYIHVHTCMLYIA